MVVGVKRNRTDKFPAWHGLQSRTITCFQSRRPQSKAPPPERRPSLPLTQQSRLKYPLFLRVLGSRHMQGSVSNPVTDAMKFAGNRLTINHRPNHSPYHRMNTPPSLPI